MKKLSILVGAIALTTSVFAQKPTDSKMSLEGQLSVAGDQNGGFGSAINFNAPAIRFRYWVADNIAVRATVSIMSKKNSFDVFEKEDDNSLRSGSYMEKMSAWSVGVGGEYHFAGTEKLSPYGGLDIKFGGGNKTTEGSNGTGTYNPLTGELMGGAFVADHSEASEAKSSSMGVNLVGGVDYYFAQNFYLGLELGWGFSSTTWKSGESSATDGIPAVIVKNVTNESKESGMSNNAVAAFRLGWRF